MNIPKQFVLSRQACIAAAIAILAAAVLSGLVSAHVVVAHENESDQSTLVPAPKEPAETNPYINLPVEPATPIDDPDINGSQMLFPVLDPLAINSLQSDGGAVHCRPGFSWELFSQTDSFSLGGILFRVWVLDSYLVVSPRSSAVESGQISIVVNGTYATPLPAMAPGDKIVLGAIDWKSEDTMWWHAEMCAKNG